LRNRQQQETWGKTWGMTWGKCSLDRRAGEIRND